MTTTKMKIDYNSILKAYQTEYARIRRADLQEAIGAYSVYNQKQTFEKYYQKHDGELLTAFHENLRAEAYERIRKKMTNEQIIELSRKRQEGKEDEYINSLRQ